ncbi:MAG TPA: UvrD-helicase domain-containing protein [Acidimicrobiia bacterium]|nr:UvrD-helicase domain-containing protein [Acidimicrobiia bacterium]
MTTQPTLFEPAGDEGARLGIRRRLGDTLFVEAGAGTGKTAALVDRVVALVRDDGVPIAAIAAITFTERAAAELRDRVRRALMRERAHPRCAAALDDLDAAAICTLHAFAQRLLTEFPIEAGLPPRVQVRDEIASAVAFDQRWRDFQDRLLDADEHEATVLLALAAGMSLDKLRAVAEAFADNWDQLDRIGAAPELPVLDLTPWIAAMEAVCARTPECIDGDDKMVHKLEECELFARALRSAPDVIEQVRMLRDAPSLRVSRTGRKTNWRCDLDEVRDELVRLDGRRQDVLDRVADAVLRRLAVVLAAFTAEDVALRRAAGELEFHDLLVLARSLLRDSEHGVHARARLRARYQRLLIDEFQDTDPIQIELAVLLASDDADAATRPWSEVAVEPGSLFFVGDPKQSIYRFRRADIATFLTARETLAPAPLLLNRNFRTVEPVLGFVNRVFGDLIQPWPASQPEYRPLEAVRGAPPGGPAVMLLGAEAHADEPDADTLREREAADVAAAVRTAVDEAWPVHDGDGWRAARLGDICVLLPARTSLGFLEQALDDAGVPYRAETSSLVYGSREVRDLLATMRAIDDPTDALMLVAALRTPLFGCGDDDLYEYRVGHGGRLDLTVAPPDTLPPEHPVAEAIRYLGALHEQRTWMSPSELLERIVRERHMLELSVPSQRFRDVARRLRFVVDQARAFTETTRGTVRDYLEWTARQSAEGARVVETVLPETDDDAVRIMTVHGAKGLEFPIVVFSGMTTRAQVRRGGVQVLFPPGGGYEIRLASGVQTDQFELHQPIDEQMSFHEKLRLLYVACTRARDHLVVSVHRKIRSAKSQAARDDDRQRWTHGDLVWEAAVKQGAVFETLDGAAPAPLVRLAPERVPPPPLDAWTAARDDAFERARRRRFVAATTLAQRPALSADARTAADPGLAKDARDLELPPWNKGRYGTAIGRAVHAVLQTIDLASGAGLAEAAAAQAAAEGVLGREMTVVALASSALASATVRDAASKAHWRETYVAIPMDGMTLEGYVDLIYRDGDGLVVVDYKTDAVGSDDELAARLDHYRIQGAAYALAVAQATGEPVSRCVFVFCDPEGAREVTLAGDVLAAALDQVVTLVADERDRPSPFAPSVFAEP